MDRTAHPERQVESDRLLKHVRQGQDGNEPQVFAGRHQIHYSFQIGDDILVAEGNTLWMAGRAGGENDLRHIIRSRCRQVFFSARLEIKRLKSKMRYVTGDRPTFRRQYGNRTRRLQDGAQKGR